MVTRTGRDGKNPYVILAHPSVFLEVDGTTKAITGYHFNRPDGVQTVEASLSLKFSLLLTKLRVEMNVVNNGKSDFAFSTVLHSYFSVNQMPVTVRGLNGLSGLKDGKPFTDNEQELVIEGATETQRLYTDVTKAVIWETKSKTGKTKRLTLTKSDNLPDIVVWNVGAQNAAGMADLEEGGDQRYLCVESGVCASDEAVVKAGQTWVAWQEVSLHSW